MLKSHMLKCHTWLSAPLPSTSLGSAHSSSSRSCLQQKEYECGNSKQQLWDEFCLVILVKAAQKILAGCHSERWLNAAAAPLKRP